MLHRDIKKMEAREKYNFHWKRINETVYMSKSIIDK